MKIKEARQKIIEELQEAGFIVKIEELEHEVQTHERCGKEVVFEESGTMENSYLMVNPEGKFQLNNNGSYQTFGDLNTTSLSEILKTVPLDPEKFGSRYVKEGVQ